MWKMNETSGFDYEDVIFQVITVTIATHVLDQSTHLSSCARCYLGDLLFLKIQLPKYHVTSTKL